MSLKVISLLEKCVKTSTYYSLLHICFHIMENPLHHLCTKYSSSFQKLKNKGSLLCGWWGVWEHNWLNLTAFHFSMTCEYCSSLFGKTWIHHFSYIQNLQITTGTFKWIQDRCAASPHSRSALSIKIGIKNLARVNEILRCRQKNWSFKKPQNRTTYADQDKSAFQNSVRPHQTY